MTTVGYGDYYPTTAIGYVTATLIMMLGIMVTALPIVIIGTNFSTVSDYNKERQRRKNSLEFKNFRSAINNSDQ